MSLSEKNKQALLALSTAEANEPTRERILEITENDEDAQAYWNQLTEVRQTLVSDANRKERAPLPTGFHQRLKKRLAPEPEIAADTPYPIAKLWKPAISAAFALTLLALLVTQWFLPQKTSSTPIDQTKPRVDLSSPAPNSWAALRFDPIDSVAFSTASTSSPISSKIPSMNWADRENWIRELDL